MYYPLSQITPNLYTNGNEFAYALSNQPYSGYYWKNSKGQYFTGKTPQDLPTEELVPISKTNNINPNQTIVNTYSEYYLVESDNIIYNQIKNVNISPNQIPTYYITFPTQQNYQIGEFKRYFCKKTNEITYLEISKETYDKLTNQSKDILYELYQPFNISWQLTGDKTQVYTTNRNIVELTMKQQKLPQFDLYLKKDYTKYYQ